MLVNKASSFRMREGEKPKAPRHASDGSLPYVTATCLILDSIGLLFYRTYIYLYLIID